MKNIAVFASGGGTDFQSIIDANIKENFCKIKLLIASKNDIYAIERAKQNGIGYAVFNKKEYNNLSEMYLKIIELLKKNEIDFIVLAGYLQILSPEIIKEYKNKIINIHPSLIPSFCGMGYYGLKVHQAVINYGAKITGCTVHFVNEEADGGAIIMQKAVEVKDDDTAESLQKRVLEAEHLLLPLAVKKLVQNKILINDRKVVVKE